MDNNEKNTFSFRGNENNESNSYREPSSSERLPNVPDSEPVIHSAKHYSDAGYVSSNEAGAVPPRYHCAGTAADKPKKAKKERRGFPGAAVIALCLVCAILGGLAGGFLPTFFADEQPVVSAPTDTEDKGDTVINMAKPGNTTQVTTNVVVDGEELKASEIYSIACDQTVAITSEITIRSFYGYSTVPVSGSGFIISSNGYILTNHHVIEDAVAGGHDISVLTYEGTEYTAEVVGYEKDNDVAVLKVDADGLSAVTIGDSDAVAVGDDVYAVGNPLGELGYTMTGGMVSAMDREITSYDEATATYNSINMFQIDAAVNSGNSGGPVYNSRGQVVGIVTAKYSDTGVEGLGFAIPINDAMKLANDIMTDGFVRGKAYMGIMVETVPSSAKQYYGWPNGAFVYGVVPGSCAEKCGLQSGDIIVKIDDTDIASGNELISAKKDYRAFDTALLQVWRNGEYLELEILFDEELPDEEEETVQPQQSQSQGGYGVPGMPGGLYEFYESFFGNPYGNSGFSQGDSTV